MIFPKKTRWGWRNPPPPGTRLEPLTDQPDLPSRAALRGWLRFVFFVAGRGLALLSLVAGIGLGVMYGLPALRSRIGHWMPQGTLIVEPTARTAIEHTVGEFLIAWQPDDRTYGPRLAIIHRAEPDHLAFFTTRGEPFLLAASGTAHFSQSPSGYSIHDDREVRCTTQRVEHVDVEPEALRLRGRLDCGRGRTVGYHLRFHARSAAALGFEVTLDSPDFNRVVFRAAALHSEHIYGLGEQLSHLELKGKQFPIWVDEQGVGRGTQPLSFVADLLAEAGGSSHASAAAIPHYVTSEARSIAIDSRDFLLFDFLEEHRIQVTVHNSTLRGRILAGRTHAELLREYTAEAGRMRPLPYWVHRGAIVGVSGGTERVRATYKALVAAQVPVAALWLQDAGGPPASSSFGRPPTGSWLLSRERYPGWQDLVADLHRDDVRVLTTVSPYLLRRDDKDGSASSATTRDLYREALEHCYLVTLSTRGCEPYHLIRDERAYGLLELRDERARTWFKAVLEAEVLRLGFDGWLAEGGELLPIGNFRSFDAGTTEPFHNRYPEEWARLLREALDAAPDRPNEKLFAIQSGSTHSPRHATLFWLGDQLATWDEHDGMKTALTGLLSSGLSGFALNHSDIGGATTLRSPLKDYRRSEELLLRWMELSAMTAVFRSHRGSSGLSDAGNGDAQVDSSPKTLAAFARAAKLYRAWSGYRMRLIAEAAQTGLPVVRPMFLHHGADPNVLGLDRQFLVGEELLVAPVLDEGQSSVAVYLPAGEWVHLWTGTRQAVDAGGKRLMVSAPLGQPAIFYRGGSLVGAELLRELQHEGLLPIAK